MQTITTYKEYLKCSNPENVESISIKNWSIHTYITIDKNFLKFKNLQILNINFFEVDDIDLLLYILHNMPCVKSTIIINDIIITVNLSKNNDEQNIITLREKKHYFIRGYNVALDKLLKNLPMIDVLTIGLIIADCYYINTPPTTKNIFIVPWSRLVRNYEVPFGCNVSYKHVCCLENIINY